MNPANKILTILSLFVFLTAFSYGQMEQYRYKRELKGVAAQWYSLVLDDDIFGKISNDLADIRIFGITDGGDTVEAPYLMRVADDKLFEKEVKSRTFNVSHNDGGFYFTFEVPGAEAVNEIRLDFSNRDFDWRVKLEGSQDQQTWFTVVDRYRILSISNGQTDFQFTKLVFPESKYRFFRLTVNSREKPELISVGILQRQVVEGKFKDYPVRRLNIRENRQLRQTEIDLALRQPVPVNHVRIVVSDTFDYYRPVTVQRLDDSIKTDQGWVYDFRTLQSGILHSLEENDLSFSSITAQQLKIVIANQHNQPLHVDAVQVKGAVHELITRFTQPAVYYLVYGNKEAVKPHYDIDRFQENIPTGLATLEVGAEQRIQHEDTPATSAIFENKRWLWAVMAVIILILGWFSIKLMRKG